MEKKIDKYLDALDKIQQPEPPLYLFSRIQQRLQEQAKLYVSSGTVRLALAFFLLLALLNVFAVQHLQSSKAKNLAEVFHVMPENNLYQ